MTGPSARALPMRERCDIMNRITRKRIETLVPALMRETGFDMWLVISQEDSHDPVFVSMTPFDVWSPVLQILIFFDRPDRGGIEMINLSRTPMFDCFDTPHQVRMPDPQWEWLSELVRERDPRRIGINESELIWAADGLSASLKARLVRALPDEYVSRLASAENLCRRWFETLIAEEVEIYPHIVGVANAISKTVASRAYVTPGETTLDDLKWGFWQICADAGLQMAVPNPHYELLRSDEMRARFGDDGQIVRPGDLIHWDVAISYLRLCTDNHQWAYVLRDGETEVPAGIRDIFAAGLRLQDIYIGEFRQGRTGNEMLESGLQKARDEGIDTPRIFSHPCSHMMHEPGPLIGHNFAQDGIPGRGDLPLNYDSAFVTEVSVDGHVAEWDGTRIRMQQEEQIIFSRDGVKYIDGRQEEIYLI